MKKNLLFLSLLLFVLFPLLAQRNNSSPLLEAVRKGDLRRVQRLIERGADINVGSSGFTPLEMAANLGHLEIVDYLLKQDAQKPQVAFEKALVRKHIEVAKYLIDSGKIDINASARSFSVFFNDQQISFEQRLQNIKDIAGDKLNSPYLLTLVQPENYQTVKTFFNINLSDKLDLQGRTILHIAASQNNVNLVKYLLDNKFNVNILDNNNHNALFYCLTSFGPNINWENPIIEDETSVRINYISDMPFYRNPNDIKMRQAQIGNMLLNAKININQQNSYGWTVLHLASISIPAGPRDYLIEKGANQNIKTKFGRTANDLLNIRENR